MAERGPQAPKPTDRDLIKAAIQRHGWKRVDPPWDAWQEFCTVEKVFDPPVRGYVSSRVEMQFSTRGRLIRAWIAGVGAVSTDKRRRVLEELKK